MRVGEHGEAGKVAAGDLLAGGGVVTLGTGDGGHRAVAHPAGRGVERESRRRPRARSQGGGDGRGAGRRRHREPEGQAGGQPLGQAVQEDRVLGRQRRERGFVPFVEEGPDGVLDRAQAEVVQRGGQLGAPPQGHGDGERVVQGRLQVDRRERGAPVRGGERVGP